MKRLWSTVKLNPPEWLSLRSASNELGIGIWRVNLLISSHILEAAENSTGDIDTSRKSIALEKQWRQGASLLQKSRRFVGYCLNFT